MKFRKDFVTNSSSSSFVCEICGETVVYYEGLADIDACMCENGHGFCKEHMLSPSRSEMIDIIAKYKEELDRKEIELMDDSEIEAIVDEIAEEWGYEELPEEFCPICQFIEYSQPEMAKYLEKEYGVSRDEVFAEVKKSNRRRKKLYDFEYIAYVTEKIGVKVYDIQASLKGRFGNYKNFLKYLKEGVTWKKE